MFSADKAKQEVLQANDNYVDNQILDAIKKGDYCCYVHSDRFADKKREELVKQGYKVSSNMTNTFYRIYWGD